MPKFTPPKTEEARQRLIDEVDAYNLERGNRIDAEYFVDYYESVGWKQGKCCKPIKDWKACIRTWEKNNRKWNQEKALKSAAKKEDNFISKVSDRSWAN